MLSSKLLETFINLFTKGSSNDMYTAVLSLVAILACFFITGKNGLLDRFKKLRRRSQLMKKFPGLRNYPFLGSMPEMAQLCRSPCHDLLPWTNKMMERFGPIYKFWTPGQPKLFILCPETAVRVMQHEGVQAKPSVAQKTARACNGEGLLAISNEIHDIRRKQWMQWMTRKTIDGSVGIFKQVSVSICKALEQFAENGQVFDILDHSIYCTLRIIGASAFGKEFVDDLSESDAKQYIHDLHTFCINLTRRTFRPWFSSNFIYFHFTPTGIETRKCIERGNNLVQKAISARKLLRKKESSKQPCFLDHLLDLRDEGHLADDQIIKELNVFIVAGYDTTGLSVCYTLYLLAKNKEHQTKVAEELREIFGENLDDFDEITPVHLKQMRYLELCIKESLRMYPIAPYSFRRSTREVALPDGKIIPPDVDVFLGIHHIHRNPKYFPEPEKFDPSRHLVPQPYYVPFALGSRNCIGQMYAMQEMKMILVHLLMKYKWETTEVGEIPVMVTALTAPVNGIHFKIQDRVEK